MSRLLRKCIALLALPFALLSASHDAIATTVSPSGMDTTGILTDLGSFAAGTYSLTASGIVDLIGDGSFRMRPDGLPETIVSNPGYPYFNPSGSFTAKNFWLASR